jgi:PadR family transcriptional regulator PadR
LPGPPPQQGAAGRIEQISGDLLAVLLKLEQERTITSEWGASGKKPPSPFLSPDAAGHKLLEAETRDRGQNGYDHRSVFEVKRRNCHESAEEILDASGEFRGKTEK